MAFTNMTATQGARLRNRIGDTDSSDYKLSDTILDAIYENASEDFDVTTVYALQELIGIYAMQPDLGGSTQYAEQRSQRYTHLKELLTYWERKTGTYGSPLTSGTLELGLDREDTDPDYLSAV